MDSAECSNSETVSPVSDSPSTPIRLERRSSKSYARPTLAVRGPRVIRKSPSNIGTDPQIPSSPTSPHPSRLSLNSAVEAVLLDPLNTSPSSANLSRRSLLSISETSRVDAATQTDPAPSPIRVATPPTSTPQAIPIVKPPPLTPMPSISFARKTIEYRPLPLSAAQWTLTSQELQSTVSRAIRASAKESFIRLLPPATLDQEIPAHEQRMEQERESAQARWRFEVQRRSMLLQGLHALSTNNPQGETIASLTTQLSTTLASLDNLFSTILNAADQQAQLARIQDGHWASALAVALRKLNASYAKRTEELKAERQKIMQLEAELDDAWAAAENIAREMDERAAGTVPIDVGPDDVLTLNGDIKTDDEEAGPPDDDENNTTNLSVANVIGVTRAVVTQAKTVSPTTPSHPSLPSLPLHQSVAVAIGSSEPSSSSSSLPPSSFSSPPQSAPPVVMDAQTRVFNARRRSRRLSVASLRLRSNSQVRGGPSGAPSRSSSRRSQASSRAARDEEIPDVPDIPPLHLQTSVLAAPSQVTPAAESITSTISLPNTCTPSESSHYVGSFLNLESTPRRSRSKRRENRPKPLETSLDMRNEEVVPTTSDSRNSLYDNGEWILGGGRSSEYYAQHPHPFSAVMERSSIPSMWIGVDEKARTRSLSLSRSPSASGVGTLTRKPSSPSLTRPSTASPTTAPPHSSPSTPRTPATSDINGSPLWSAPAYETGTITFEPPSISIAGRIQSMQLESNLPIPVAGDEFGTRRGKRFSQPLTPIEAGISPEMVDF